MLGTPPAPNGTRFAVIDFPPGNAAIMHRTESIDYVLVLAGQIEMDMDESTVTLKAGDIMVQRGTNHAWVNRGTERARVAFILIDAKPLGIGHAVSRGASARVRLIHHIKETQMARIPALKPEEMTDAQRLLAQQIAATRGGVVRGPFAIWLRNPALVERANALGDFLREGTSVPRRLSELAILVTARHWTAQYEWYAHENQARELGVSDATIEAIRHRRRPSLDKKDEQAVYDLVSELYEKKSVSDATYKAAVASLGDTMVIELVTIATFYAMIAMVLVAFEAPLPEGAKPPLPIA